MIEILFIYQLARNPLQVIARRWWCRGLFRAFARQTAMPGKHQFVIAAGSIKATTPNH